MRNQDLFSVSEIQSNINGEHHPMARNGKKKVIQANGSENKQDYPF